MHSAVESLLSSMQRTVEKGEGRECACTETESLWTIGETSASLQYTVLIVYGRYGCSLCGRYTEGIRKVYGSKRRSRCQVSRCKWQVCCCRRASGSWWRGWADFSCNVGPPLWQRSSGEQSWNPPRWLHAPTLMHSHSHSCTVSVHKHTSRDLTELFLSNPR